MPSENADQQSIRCIIFVIILINFFPLTLSTLEWNIVQCVLFPGFALIALILSEVGNRGNMEAATGSMVVSIIGAVASFANLIAAIAFRVEGVLIEYYTMILFISVMDLVLFISLSLLTSSKAYFN